MKVDISDLQKVYDALVGNETFHRHRDAMNGAVHLAREVRFSPLTSETIAARERVEAMMQANAPDPLPGPGERVVVVDGSVWPWPGDTKLPWQVWNEVPHPDGMTVHDPDGFRFGRPTIVTWDEFEKARRACTMMSGRGGHEVPR